MESLTTFTSAEFGDVRTIVNGSKAVFCAKDIASALGYTNPNKAIVDHCRGVTFRYPIQDALGRTQETRFIEQPDVLRLIVSSKLPAAERFEAWVFEEILPSVLNHGGYMAGQESMSPEQMALASMRWLESKIAEQEARIEMMRPKAALGEAMEGSDDAMSVTEAHRHVSALHPWVKREWCFSRLRAAGMMCLASKAPTADGIRTGRLVAVSHPFIDRQGNKRISEQYSRVTPKGVRWLLAKAEQEEAAL